MADTPTSFPNDEGGTLDVEFVPEAPPKRTAGGAIREEAGKLGGQAGDRLKAFASDGKDRASGAIGEFAKMIDDAAAQVDDKLGAQFGGYARQAAGSLSGLADAVRDKDVDDLIDDARLFVQKSPAVAIGIAAAVGFAFARVLRSGVDANRDA